MAEFVDVGVPGAEADMEASMLNDTATTEIYTLALPDALPI